MTRLLRHALLALLLLFSQQAAQLHALGHALSPAGSAIALAAADDVPGEKSVPATGHPAEHCLAFHAIDCALPGVAPSAAGACTGVTPVADFSLPLPFALRVAFDSRAPPELS
jgi:hypothetical protein